MTGFVAWLLASLLSRTFFFCKMCSFYSATSIWNEWQKQTFLFAPLFICVSVWSHCFLDLSFSVTLSLRLLFIFMLFDFTLPSSSSFATFYVRLLLLLMLRGENGRDRAQKGQRIIENSVRFCWFWCACAKIFVLAFVSVSTELMQYW